MPGGSPNRREVDFTKTGGSNPGVLSGVAEKMEAEVEVIQRGGTSGEGRGEASPGGPGDGGGFGIGGDMTHISEI